jgi:WD40 repeat protein/anti-sigma factor RsiW
MPTLHCPNLNELEQFLMGLGDPDSAEGMERHLSECEHCSARARSLTAEDDLVRTVQRVSLTDDTPDPASVESLTTVFRQAIHQVVQGATASWATRDFSQADPPQRVEVIEPRTAIGPIRHLGRYELQAVLGVGGMGVVYRAFDPSLQRAIAIKVIRKELLSAAGMLDRFLAEARAIAAVEHDNIVVIHAVEVYDEIPCIVMPLLKGETLADYLGRHPQGVPEDRIRRLARETLSGLSAAHASGLIHRDIKPGNIWLEGETVAEHFGRVKILDFGLVLESGSSAGPMSGTPGYMAPEQIRNGVIDRRADLFSVGCVLYQMATGRSPFAGETPTVALVKTVTRPPEPIRTLRPAFPAALASMIERLLEKEADRRPNSAAEVLAELGALDHQAELRQRRTGRRKWLGGLVAAGLLGGLGVSFLEQPEPVRVPVAMPILAPVPESVAIEFQSDPDIAKLIAKVNGQERIWELPRDAKVSLPPGDYDVRLAEEMPGRKLEPQQFTVLPNEPKTIRFSLPGLVAQSQAHDGGVSGVTIIPGEENASFAVVSASLDRTLNTWLIGAKGEPNLARLSSPAKAFAATPDGRILATAGGNRSEPFELDVQLWNGKNLVPLGPPLAGHTRLITGLAISPDGQRLLSIAPGEVWLRTLPLQRREELVGHEKARVTAAAFSRNGLRVVTADDQGTLRIWDATNSNLLKTIRDSKDGTRKAIRGIAVLPEGFLTVGEDGRVLRWDEVTFKPRELTVHPKALFCIAASADGKRYLTGSEGGAVLLGSTETGTILSTMTEHRGGVTCVAFSSDQRHAVSGGDDRRVNLWRLPLP